jgi:hypothetical protein
MKKELLTPEFWVTIGTHVLNFLVMTGYINTGDATTLNGNIGKIVAGVVAVVSTAHYLKGQAIKKAAEHAASVYTSR